MAFADSLDSGLQYSPPSAGSSSLLSLGSGVKWNRWWYRLRVPRIRRGGYIFVG
jgi:hypothetical protein